MKQNITTTALLERLQRKLQPSMTITEDDFIENIWNALKLIGIKQQEEYYLVSSITDNKVLLPEWVDSIDKVLYLENNKTVSEIEQNLSYNIDIAKPMSQVDSFINNRHTTEGLYLIRNNYLHTNLSKGNLIILYSSIPIDEEGNPLIENEIHLIEAIIWYNIKEILWGLTIRNPNQYSALLQKAEREWSYYSIQAKTASIFPKNEDSMLHLRNKFMKLLPNFNV